MSPNSLTTRSIFAAGMVIAAMLVGVCLTSCTAGPPEDSSSSATGTTPPAVPPTPPVAPPTPVVTTPITQVIDDPANPGVQVIMTSANTLTAGAFIVISGATNPTYNGTFAIVSATATTFTVAAVFVGDDTTAVWLAGGGVITGCVTTGDTGAITLNYSTTRFTGTAPLAVQFDATGTTMAAPGRPFHDLEYRWDFGDPGSGTWARGSRAGSSSKNAALGPVAAHVYESPGTYLVTLTVTDGTNTVTNACTQIAALDPNAVYGGANTTCVNASGAVHAGCPLIPLIYADSAACILAGRCVTQPSFDIALATFFGAGKRVLFKGGDTFTASNQTTYSGVGPAQVGSYGGGQARINGSPGGNGYFFVALTSSDLRITNLEFDGSATSAQVWMTFQNTAWSNVLLLNNYVHNYANFLNGVDWASSGGFGFFVFGNRFETPDPTSLTDMTLVSQGSIIAIIGNNFAMNGIGQQVVRINHSNNFVVTDNDVSGAAGVPGNQKETIAVRSSPTRSSNFGVISGNSVSVGPGYVGIFPSNASANLGVFDVIIEGNYIFGAGSGLTTNAIHTNAERITIRNNIIDATDPNMDIGILLRGTNGGFSLPSKDVQVYNNSIYSSQPAGALAGITVDTDVSTGNVIRNNLVFTSGITGTVISDAGNKATKSNNTGDPVVAPGIVTLNPNWTITVPMTPLTNFTPGAGSYAIDTGATVPVFSDFFGAARTGTYDLGAVNP